MQNIAHHTSGLRLTSDFAAAHAKRTIFHKILDVLQRRGCATVSREAFFLMVFTCLDVLVHETTLKRCGRRGLLGLVGEV